MNDKKVAQHPKKHAEWQEDCYLQMHQSSVSYRWLFSTFQLERLHISAVRVSSIIPQKMDGHTSFLKIYSEFSPLFAVRKIRPPNAFVLKIKQ